MKTHAQALEVQVDSFLGMRAPSVAYDRDF